MAVTKRDAKSRAELVRQGSLIPGVLYGKGHDNEYFSVDYQTFRRLYTQAGENTLIELKLEGDKSVPVLVHEIQYDPVTDAISHIDLIVVDMSKKVTAHVPLRMVGVALAVKDLGGILTVHKHEIEVRCLPKDLIHSIDVDISGLVDFHTAVHIKDLKVPSSIEVLEEAEDTVVNVTALKVEEEKPVEAVAVEGAATGVGDGAAVATGVAAAPNKEGAESGKKA